VITLERTRALRADGDARGDDSFKGFAVNNALLADLYGREEKMGQKWGISGYNRHIREGFAESWQQSQSLQKQFQMHKSRLGRRSECSLTWLMIC
jgi:hypothetical protein